MIKSAQDWPAEYSWSISAFIRVVSVFVPQGRLLWAWNSYEQTPQSLVDLFWVCQLYNWWVHMWLYIQLYSMCTPLQCIVCTVAILRVEFKLHLRATSLLPRVMLPSPVRGLHGSPGLNLWVGIPINIPHTINHCLCNYKQNQYNMCMQNRYKWVLPIPLALNTVLSTSLYHNQGVSSCTPWAMLPWHR